MPFSPLPTLRNLLATTDTMAGNVNSSTSGAAPCGRRNLRCHLSLAYLVPVAILRLPPVAHLSRVAYTSQIAFMTRLGSSPAAIPALMDLNALGRLCAACTATGPLLSTSPVSAVREDALVRGSSFSRGLGPPRSLPCSRLRLLPFS